MKRALLIASAVAAVVAGQALAESGSDQPIDEKCYGVSPHDVRSAAAIRRPARA